MYVYEMYVYSIECKSHNLLCVNFHKKVNQFKCYKLKTLHSTENLQIYIRLSVHCVCLYVCKCAGVCTYSYSPVQGRAFALRLKLSMHFFVCGILALTYNFINIYIYVEIRTFKISLIHHQINSQLIRLPLTAFLQYKVYKVA